MTLASSPVKNVPALDENSFQRLLAAAYVVQQHNETVRARESRLSTSQVLTQVAEIESLARTCSLDITGICALAADRLRKMTEAAGVSIGLVTDGYLDCVAESGVPARIPGSSLASHSLVATERLKAGEIFESDNAENDIRLDVGLSRELKTGSLVAAPVHRFGELSGLVEVRWEHAKAFQEGDSRACRMMAELITRTVERTTTESQVTARPVSPEVAATSESGENTRAEVDEVGGEETRPQTPPLEQEQTTEALPDRCRVCGQSFGSDEVFCGNCSMPRLAASPAEGLQSKWASMWYMQQAQDVRRPRDTSARTEPRWLVPAPEITPVEQTSTASPEENKRSLWSHPAESATEPTTGVHSINVDLDALVEEEPQSLLRRFSENVSGLRRYALASTLGGVAVFLVLAMWAFSPSPANTQITRFESLLVELGLAEVPGHTTGMAGRPEARVWVDVHTALYYCEGSDLYGKTPEGRFASQRDAQQDQFQPASQTPCK